MGLYFQGEVKTINVIFETSVVTDAKLNTEIGFAMLATHEHPIFPNLKRNNMTAGSINTKNIATIWSIVKIRNSRKMALRPQFQRRRNPNLETRDQSATLQVIRAALQLAATASERYDKKCRSTVTTWRFSTIISRGLVYLFPITSSILLKNLSKHKLIFFSIH